MEHSIIYDKTHNRYEAYEDNIPSGCLQIEINNNSMKIIDISTGSLDPNYRTGTELVLYALNHCGTTINSIHGMLSLEDAPEHTQSNYIKADKIVGWKKSILFYESLSESIYLRTGLKYDFHLYIGRQVIDVTNEYFDCTNREEYINQLITRASDPLYRFCSFILKLAVNDN